MKRILIVFLLLFSLPAWAEHDPIAAPRAAKALAIAEYAVTPDEMTASIAAGISTTLTYYLATSANNISGPRSLESTPSVAPWSVTSAALSGSYSTWASWTTQLGFPGLVTLKGGPYSFNLATQKSTGAPVEIVRELWTLNSAGTVATFVASSTAYNIASTNTTAHLETVYFVLASETTILVSDRLQIRVWGRTTGAGAAPTITVSGGDGNQSFFTFPVVSATTFAQLNEPNTFTGPSTFTAPVTFAATSTFQQRLLAADGSITAPAFSFTNALGGGMHRTAAGTIRVGLSGDSADFGGGYLSLNAATGIQMGGGTYGAYSSNTSGYVLQPGAYTAYLTKPLYSVRGAEDSGFSMRLLKVPVVVSNGVEVQSWATDTATISRPVILNVASGGIQIYQGNAVTFGADASAQALPIAIASTVIPLLASTVYDWSAVVIERNNTSLTATTFRVDGAFHTLNGSASAVAIGSMIGTVRGASGTTGINDSASYTFTIAPLLDSTGFHLTASGTASSIWQVKKFEIGGL